jgi:hypothetical protein
VIFSELAVYKYGVLVVKEDFLSGVAPDWIEIFGQYPDQMDWLVQEVEYLQTDLANFKKLDNEACIQAYSTPLPTAWGDLLVIAEDNTTSATLLDWDYVNQLDV